MGKPQPPLLFVKDRPTRALELLRCAADHGPLGLPHPYTPASFDKYGDCVRVWGPQDLRHNERVALQNMERRGWVECGPFGPRGGRRWRITEEGNALLSVANNYPPGSEAMQLAFKLIGH